MRTEARRLLSRGISLVELMVGIAVGLLVVAAATTMVTAQLGSTRQVLLETQLDQDLRTAAEVVTRELRRSSASVIEGFGLWYSTGQLQTNATDGMAADLTPGDASSISIRYRRGPGEEGFGFKLENDTVKMLIPDGGAGVWQELTDPLSVKITKFSIDTKRAGGRERSDNLEPHIIPCPYLCPDGTTDCWPRARPQEYTLSIEGESLRDGTVRRSLSTSVATRSLTTSFEVFPGQQGQNNQACPTLPN